MHHRSQSKIKCSQAQDGKNIAGVHNKWIWCNCENGRNRVNSKDQIRNFHQNQTQQQRRCKQCYFPSLGVWFAYGESLAVQCLGDSHARLEKLQHRVVGNIRFVINHDEHFDARGKQDDTKQIHHPRKLHDQRCPQPNHDGAQHNHAQNAPEQDAVLVFTRNREVREDQRDDENVVHRQRLFHQIARHVQLYGCPCSGLCAVCCSNFWI